MTGKALRYYTIIDLDHQKKRGLSWELGIRIDAQGVVAYIDDLCLFPVEAATSYFSLEKTVFAPEESIDVTYTDTAAGS